jgi:hypothetical protein
VNEAGAQPQATLLAPRGPRWPGSGPGESPRAARGSSRLKPQPADQPCRAQRPPFPPFASEPAPYHPQSVAAAPPDCRLGGAPPTQVTRRSPRPEAWGWRPYPQQPGDSKSPCIYHGVWVRPGQGCVHKRGGAPPTKGVRGRAGAGRGWRPGAALLGRAVGPTVTTAGRKRLEPLSNRGGKPFQTARGRARRRAAHARRGRQGPRSRKHGTPARPPGALQDCSPASGGARAGRGAQRTTAAAAPRGAARRRPRSKRCCVCKTAARGAPARRAGAAHGQGRAGAIRAPSHSSGASAHAPTGRAGVALRRGAYLESKLYTWGGGGQGWGGKQGSAVDAVTGRRGARAVRRPRRRRAGPPARLGRAEAPCYRLEAEPERAEAERAPTFLMKSRMEMNSSSRSGPTVR